MKAIRDGWLWVPVGAFNNIERLRESLTCHPKQYSGEPRPDPILMYREENGLIAVPRALGTQKLMGRVDIEDRTSLGSPITYERLPDPNHPRVQNPAMQAQFMRDMYDAALQKEGFIATAHTGSGKTVVALHTAAKLGRTTLILVHLERLMYQWVDEIEDKLGVSRDSIGIIRQNQCDYEGKAFCVGLLQSMAKDKYPPEFKDYFGTVIVDEVHKIGCRSFSQVTPMFPAKYRIGLSATPTRRDKTEELFFSHIGPIEVSSKATALPIDVHVVRYTTRRPLWGTNHGARIQCISRDSKRNDNIAKLISACYREGRQTLVISESIDHIEELMRSAIALGVPEEEIGQFTGQRTVQVQGESGETINRRRKIPSAELERVKAESSVIFATYGMMTEGIDIPRLDAGIDATPRSSATQLIGRIRRPVPGKRTPVWVTIYDTACSRSERYLNRRMDDYNATGCNIIGGLPEWCRGSK